jgi:hypothetical protein
MPERSGRAEEAGGEAAREAVSDETQGPRRATESTGSGPRLTAALTRENLQRAWRRVKANQGSAGVDGLDLDPTGQYLKTAWPDIRNRLLRGTYRPSPVRRVTIPKPDGGQPGGAYGKHEYQRLGEEGARPHRIRYKPLHG